MLAGKFPQYLVHEFAEMLSYFGQSPIIVRSSSLLEDAYGNAFSGKYESVFFRESGTARQAIAGVPLRRQTIYASTMSEKALATGAARAAGPRRADVAPGVRVSGACYGSLFFPQIAGVGLCATLTSGTSASTPAPASCDWCSAWACGRSIARTTTTPASSR